LCAKLYLFGAKVPDTLAGQKHTGAQAVHRNVVNSAILKIASAIKMVEESNVMGAAEESQRSHLERWIKTVPVSVT
jgi:hypothetical protein